MPISYSTYNEGIDSDLNHDNSKPTNSDYDLGVYLLNESFSLENKNKFFKFREIYVIENNINKYVDVMKLTTNHKIITLLDKKENVDIDSIDSTLLFTKKFFLNVNDYDQVEIIQKSYKLKITTLTKVINVIGNQYKILTENGFVDIEDLKKNYDESTLDFLKDENGALIKIKVLKHLDNYYLKSFGISDISEKDYFHTEKISVDDYPYMKFKQKKINFDVKKVYNVQTTLLKFNIGEATDSLSAKLRLYNTKKSGQNLSGKINVYKQLSDWQVVETGNPSPKFSKPTLLNVMKGELIGTIDFDSTQEWIEFTNDNLKNVVNSWIANPDSNHGIYLEGKFEESKLSTDGYMVAASFASFESSYLAFSPQLILGENIDIVPWKDIIMDGPFDGTVYTKPYTYKFPSGSQSWAGFAYATANTNPISFSLGGTITFKAKAKTNTNIKFKFERLPYNAEGNGPADTLPWYQTDTVFITTDEKEYTIFIETQYLGRTWTFSSFLLFLESNDVEVTLSDLNVNNFKKYEDKIENVDYKQHTNGVVDNTTNNLIITTTTNSSGNPETYNPSWYGATNIIDWEEGLTKPTPRTTIVRDSRFVNTDGSLKSKEDMKQYINEYMNLMESKVCVFNLKYNTIFIRDAVEPSKYYLKINRPYEVHFLPEATQDLFGVEDHNDIEIPKKT